MRAVYIPPFAKIAKDGAPERLCFLKEGKSRARHCVQEVTTSKLKAVGLFVVEGDYGVQAGGFDGGQEAGD